MCVIICAVDKVRVKKMVHASVTKGTALATVLKNFVRVDVEFMAAATKRPKRAFATVVSLAQTANVNLARKTARIMENAI